MSATRGTARDTAPTVAAERGTSLAMWAAFAVFLALFLVLRLRNWVPFAMAGFTFVAIWLGTLPVRGRSDRKIDAAPDGETGEAVRELDAAAARLREFARRASPADRVLFEHLAGLLGRIAGHHRANPGHAQRTRIFRRHVVGRMVRSVADYMDLCRRAGPDQSERLAEISRQLEEYVPALERIDRACIDNDLTELEISIDVLNEQMKRRR